MKDVLGYPFYLIALFLIKMKKWKKAEQNLAMALRIRPGHPIWSGRLAALLLRRKSYEHAISLYLLAIKHLPPKATWYYGLGVCYSNIKKNDLAADAFQKAINLAHNRPGYYDHLAAIYRRQGKIWQEVEALKRATELDPSKPTWFFRLGEAYDVMSRYQDAVKAFRKATKLRPGESTWFYRLGYSAEQAGDLTISEGAFERAVELDQKNNSARFGVGAFHQARGLWTPAIVAYTRQLETQPQDAELYQRLGNAYDRCYQWKQASDMFRVAVALNMREPNWHYRLGFVEERQGNWDAAADAYFAAIHIAGVHKPYWQFRLGYVLENAARFEDAVEAYLKTDSSYASTSAEETEGLATSAHAGYFASLANGLSEILRNVTDKDATNSEVYFRLGEAAEAQSNWQAAASFYRGAIQRCDNHKPSQFYRLGVVLSKDGLWKEACAAFRETRILKRPHGVDTGKYEADQQLKRIMTYAEFRDTLPLAENTILLESNSGNSVSCNPLAIFDEMQKMERFEQFHYVWSVQDEKKIPARLKPFKNVTFVKRDSDLYNRYLATAKYLVNNTTFHPYFVTRPGQQYLNTWHGTPLKALGKDTSIPGEFMTHTNTARNLLQATHVISPNAHTTHVLIDRNDIRGVFSGKLAETGYPRIDKMINADEARKEEIRKKIGLASGSKVVLYAPTWRGAVNSVELDATQLIADIQALSALPYQVMFRGHHFSEKALSAHKLPVLIPDSTVDTYDLLAVTDILITDYSSIFFDFLPSRREFLIYAYDLDQYIKERGALYFDIHEVPAPICRNIEELCISIREAASREFVPDEKYEAFLDKFASHEDGHASEKAIEFFFDNDGSNEVDLSADDRIPLLFYSGSFTPNGIAKSFINLVQNLDLSVYRVCVAVDPADISKNPANALLLEKISDKIQIIGRSGRAVSSPEEKWIFDKFMSQNDLASQEMWDVYNAYSTREFLRLFGPTTFGAVIHFDGYNRFWASILANAPGDQGNRLFFLHNDMQREHLEKYPQLIGLFRMLNRFDVLVSVSKSVSEENAVTIPKLVGRNGFSFDYCHNLISQADVFKRAQEPLDPAISRWAEGAVLFGNLGRLSPEKGQIKLIKAFAKVHLDHPQTKLVIAGEGPLRDEINRLIKRLNLQNAVMMAGLVANPMPLMKRLDCFVFASNYEGQGIALLEALVLGTPAISTDVVGSRSVLEGGNGLLVKNSEAGLEHGMRAFLDGKVLHQHFDYHAYEREALEKFVELINVPKIAVQKMTAL